MRWGSSASAWWGMTGAGSPASWPACGLPSASRTWWRWASSTRGPHRGPPDPIRLAKSSYTAMLSAPLLGQLLTQRLGAIPLLLKASRASGSFTRAELATYSDRFREPDRARATVSLYRTFLLRELGPLLRGAYGDRRLTVPTRLLIGAEDPVFKGDTLSGYEDHAEDMRVEWLGGVGHWLPEESPELVLDRLAAFLGR